jgi:mono/diheme cytochrome c family protein
VTEIPEHLLKRAAQRRAALSGSEAPAESSDTPAAPAPAAGDAPAPTAPAKKAPAPLPTLDDEPAKAVPDPPVIAAAKARKRVPYWAAALIASLPLWAFFYVFSIDEPDVGLAGAAAIGEEVYAQCATCHGPAGQGSGETGQQLSDGEVLLTVPDPLAMVHWIRFGADEGARPDGTYGHLDRPGGPRNIADLSGKMSAFPDIDAEELAAVVIYIREELSGGDPADDPNFNSETFEAHPEDLATMVEQVTELGPTGDPDLSGIEGAETGEMGGE